MLPTIVAAMGFGITVEPESSPFIESEPLERCPRVLGNNGALHFVIKVPSSSIDFELRPAPRQVPQWLS